MPTPTPNVNIGAAVAVQITPPGGSATMAFVKSGKIDRAATAIKVTNSRSGGFQQYKGGIRGADVSLELVYDGDSVLSIVEGTECTVIMDSIGYETSESLANPTTTPAGRLITAQVLITGVSDTWEVDGDYGVTITGKTTGAYTVVDTATGATDIT